MVEAATLLFILDGGLTLGIYVVDSSNLVGLAGTGVLNGCWVGRLKLGIGSKSGTSASPCKFSVLLSLTLVLVWNVLILSLSLNTIL